MDFTAIFTLVWPFLIEWWPFVAVSLILWYIGQNLKKIAPKPEVNWFWKLYWMTLWAHPILVGIGLAFLGLPVPVAVEALGNGAAELYYSAAGVVSVVWHDAWRTWKKYKTKKEE